MKVEVGVTVTSVRTGWVLTSDGDQVTSTACCETCHYNNDHNDNDNDTRQCDKHQPRAESSDNGVWVGRYFKTSHVKCSVFCLVRKEVRY